MFVSRFCVLSGMFVGRLFGSGLLISSISVFSVCVWVCVCVCWFVSVVLIIVCV